MKQTDRPDNKQPCAESDCQHGFGDHYKSFDGFSLGCAGRTEGQRGEMSRCDCEAFLVKYTYPIQDPS